MPRINAATVAEHVAHQEAAVIGASRRLFNARGVRAVTLSDIAAEVGLSRTALYRYFPTKAHILQRWFESTMEPLIEDSRAAIASPGTEVARFDCWLDVQIAFIVDDEHAALVSAALQSEELPEDVRRHIGQRHRDLYATLGPVLEAAAKGDASLIRTRASLIAAIVRSAGDLLRDGGDPALIRAELLRVAQGTAGLS